jgi:hypothetical protein
MEFLPRLPAATSNSISAAAMCMDSDVSLLGGAKMEGPSVGDETTSCSDPTEKRRRRRKVKDLLPSPFVGEAIGMSDKLDASNELSIVTNS